MRFRSLATVLVFGAAALACSKDSETKTVAVSDLPDGAIPRDFQPDPLGTIPPMGNDEPDPTPTQGLAATAPSGSSAQAASATAASPGAPKDASTKPTFKLLSAGDAPRRKLRYKFVAGQSELVNLDFSMAMSVDAGDDSPPEQKLPAMRFSLLVGMKSVSPDGEAAYEFQLAGADVAKDPRVPQQVQQGLRGVLGQLRGVGGTGFVSARGIEHDLAMSAPSTVPQQAETFLNQLQMIVGDMIPPFPEEEVGKGARWERSMRIDALDAKVFQKSTYTLIDTSDSGGSVSVVVTQSAPPASLQSVGGAAGVHIDALTGSGTGTAAFTFNRFGPTSTEDTTSVLSLSGSQGGQVKHVKQTSKTSFKISGTLAPKQ